MQKPILFLDSILCSPVLHSTWPEQKLIQKKGSKLGDFQAVISNYFMVSLNQQTLYKKCWKTMFPWDLEEYSHGRFLVAEEQEQCNF